MCKEEQILTFVDSRTGGRVLTDWRRLQKGLSNKAERVKFYKEQEMARDLACHGFRIEHLYECPGISSPDIRIDGKFAELKYLTSHNNLVHHAKKAVEKQGAEWVIIKLAGESREIHNELDKLPRMGIHGIYYFLGREESLFPF